MCEGSIHVAHRNMTESEDLVVRTIPSHGIPGYFPADPAAKDKRLVCVRKVTNAVIERLEFRPELVRNVPAELKKMAGKANVKAELHHAGYQDTVVIGGHQIMLACLAEGTRIGIPPTKVGVAAVNAAIDEQVKTGLVDKVVGRVRRTVKAD